MAADVRVIESHKTKHDWKVLGNISFTLDMVINVSHTSKELRYILESVEKGEWQDTNS
jgi:hypothetical protein